MEHYLRVLRKCQVYSAVIYRNIALRRDFSDKMLFKTVVFGIRLPTTLLKTQILHTIDLILGFSECDIWFIPIDIHFKGNDSTLVYTSIDFTFPNAIISGQVFGLAIIQAIGRVWTLQQIIGIDGKLDRIPQFCRYLNVSPIIGRGDVLRVVNR